MTLQFTRWRRLLTFTALLVITTGMAAAPMRNAVGPYFSDTLGSWALTKNVASAVSSARQSMFGLARETDELDATRLATTLTSADAGDSQHSLRGAGLAAGQSGSWRLGEGTNWRSFGWWGGWGANSSWFNGRGFGRTAGGGSGSGFGGGSVRGASGGGGSRFARGSGSRPPIFGEHRSGPGGLTSGGAGGSGAAGGTIGPTPTLAATPEPSTLLLFGTGLATAAGAIRRRLRRR